MSSGKRPQAATRRGSTRRGSAAVAGGEDVVLRFTERFAALLSEAGIPRMPARVFVALLTSDTGRLTAAELAERLQVSPAAISGAVRYLTQVNLAGREREPGSRRDVYGVHGDIWYEAVLRREHVLARWQAGLRDGIELVGAGTPAGDRLTETLAFFDFVQAEMPPMLERWRVRKLELRAGDANEPADSRPPGRS